MKMGGHFHKITGKCQSDTHTPTLAVKSWAGGESMLGCGIAEGRRRSDDKDSWDQELDTGKVLYTIRLSRAYKLNIALL